MNRTTNRKRTAWSGPILATILLLAGPMASQGHGPAEQRPRTTPKPRPGKTGALPRGEHRPVRGISPRRALRHLQDGNLAWLVTRSMPAWRRPVGEPEPQIVRKRPAGSGPIVAAVVQPAGAAHPATSLFACAYRDLLTLTSPGPRLRAAEVAAIEQVAIRKGVSLAVVLVQGNDPMFVRKYREPTNSEQILQRHVQAAREHAQRTKLSIAAAHGMLQAQVLWRSSERLRKLRRKGRFEVAVGVITKSDRIEWVTHWHLRPPLITSGEVRRRDAEEAARKKSRPKAKSGQSARPHK